MYPSGFGRLRDLLRRGSSAPAGARWDVPAIFRNGTFPVNLTGTVAANNWATDYASATFEDTGTTYYVRTTGNDTTGDGSSGNPWATLAKAVTTAASGSRIDIGAGVFAPAAAINNKNLSLIGAGQGQTFIGDLLSSGQVTLGALASGRQTATLASSTVSGFVDLTRLKRGHPEVSRVATTAAGIATWQAGGDPGVFRSTPSQVGAGDGRDLTGKIGTEILMWSAAAISPLQLTGTSRVYARGISFVGGARIECPSTGRLVMEGCRTLGAHNENCYLNGLIVLKDVIARGCSVSNADVLNYASGGQQTRAVEINCLADQANAGGSDNSSTTHGGIMMRVGGQYYDGNRAVNDNGGVIVGQFGSFIQVSNQVGAFSLGVGVLGEGHYAGITFGATAGDDASFLKDAAPASRLKVYDYDGCLTGKKIVAGSVPIIDRSGVRPTSDTAFLTFDPSNLATLFQDTAGTIPVTAAGQTVARINSTSSATDYATVVAASLTYQTDGTRHWLQSGGTANTLRLSLFTDTVFDEVSHMIWAIQSSDTSGLLMTQGSTNSIIDYRSANALFGTPDRPQNLLGSPTVHVDGNATPVGTTATALRTAAFNNAPHIITVRNANVAYVGWLTATNFMLQFDGQLRGFQIVRATTNANLRAWEAAMAAKAGATLV